MFKAVTSSSSLKIIKLSTTSKKLVLLSLSIIVTAISLISSNGGSDYESSSFTVFAQIEKDTNQKMLLHTQSMANSNNSINANITTTFSSIGTISSLVITVPENEFNITNAFKVILTGDWVLNVHNGTVTNFEANFLASPMDGSRGHIHQITNFSANENEMIQLAPDDNSLSINGTADIKINGLTIWNDVDLSIIISKGSTITIDPNDKQTDNHFGDQQVYGIVNRLIVM
ncbi:MAG TPA: hypothetical protein VHJ38_05135 [Nitrososphaeraceae archaeon]|nr:hypothetical protein [Nitrososphaeraceae archaeon]